MYETFYNAFENDGLASLVRDPGSLPASRGSPLRSDASAPERDLIVLYSAITQGLKSETVLPCPSAAEFLSSKINWAINEAGDEFQLASMLNLLSAFSNKRFADIQQSLAGQLESIWTERVIASTAGTASRLRAIRVYFHVSIRWLD